MTPLSLVAPSPAPARAAGAAAAPPAPEDAGAFEALLAEASPTPEGRGRGGARGRVERDPDAAPADGAAAPDPSSIVTFPVVALPAPPVEPEPFAPAPTGEPAQQAANLQAETGEPVAPPALAVRTPEATAVGIFRTGDSAGIRRQSDGPFPPAPAGEPAAQATAATPSAAAEASPATGVASVPAAVLPGSIATTPSVEPSTVDASTTGPVDTMAVGPRGPDSSRPAVVDRPVPERSTARVAEAVEIAIDNARPAADSAPDPARAARDAAREALRAAIARGMPASAGQGAEVRQARLEEGAAHVPQGPVVIDAPPADDVPADAPPAASDAATPAPRGRGAEPQPDGAEPAVDSGAPSVAAAHSREASAGFDSNHGADRREMPRTSGLPAAASAAAPSMPAFLGHLERATGAATTSEGALYAGPAADPAAAGPQIVKSLHLLANARGGEARLRLAPEHLGSVTVLMKVEGDRVVATLQAETAAVRGWIAAHQDVLRDQLADLGLRLEELVVTEDPRDTPDGQAEQQQEKPQPQPRRPLQRHREDAPRFEVIV